MRANNIEKNGFYSDGKMGVREVLSIEPDESRRKRRIRKHGDSAPVRRLAADHARATPVDRSSANPSQRSDKLTNWSLL